VEALIERDTAGSPVDEDIRWTNRSVPELAEELQEQGFEIGTDALRRILFDELGFLANVFIPTCPSKLLTGS
jgi:hypothetical protein